MTLRQEQLQWLKNYDVLLSELRFAYNIKDKRAIDEINKRILTTQVQIASVTYALEKQSNPDAYNAISTPVGPSIKIADNPTLNLDSPDGDGCA